MGYYIDPLDRSKEQWLEENGTPIPAILDVQDFIDEQMLPVVLVDNGPFTAAGIAFSQQERQAFLNPYDDRPKKFYKVPIEKLCEVNSKFGRDMPHIR